MAVVSIFKSTKRADFSTLVLRGLVELDDGAGELCLELGVSYWIAHSQERLDEAVPAMLAMRAALVEASGLDLASEPHPFWGVNPRIDVLNLADYLRGLIVRAAREATCGVGVMVERALHLLRENERSSAPLRALG